EALRDIHRVGLVHRDLKPGNVLMTEDGPRVIDFGISRAADHQSLTTTGRMIGTPPFMSPEQMASPRDVTPASDVFSLGSLLVFAAVGAGPFDSDSPYITGYQVAFGAPDLTGVPGELLSTIERCLAKDPADRPALADVQHLLKALPEDVPGSTAPKSRPTPRSSPTTVPVKTSTGTGRKRRRTRLLLATLGAVLAITGTTYLTSRNPEGAASTNTTPTPELPAGWKPWQVALRYEVKGIPLEYDNPACVTESGALYCGGTGFTTARVDAASGRVAWRTGTRPQGAGPIGVRGGIVYTYEQPADRTRRVVALDSRTGKARWRRDINTAARAVLYDGGLLTLSPDASEFIAYGPTGAELWRAPSLDEYCTPAALGGVPYALCEQGTEPGQAPVELMRVEPDSLSTTATLPKKALALGAVGGQPLFLAPQTAEDVYKSGYERPYDALLRVDPATGHVTRVPLARALTGTATLIGGVVYFVRSDGSVTAVSAADGKQLWQRVTDVESLSAPVVSTRYGRVYFANRYGRLLALDSRTGAEVWATSALPDPGDKVQGYPPQVLLVDDAIVGMAGDTAFS
ncbi:PQQ-binding-like beta-propeller repeat protein, partial [Streptomyces niveiscabiei]